MFSLTVYQGKSAYSWNTTARSQPGPVISLPPTQISPRVGCSKPASRLSSVVLPQPEGPTSEKNSFCWTSKLPSCSASSGSPFDETCTLLIWAAFTGDVDRLIVTVFSLALVPGHDQQRQPAHQEVEQESEHADQHHSEQD